MPLNDEEKPLGKKKSDITKRGIGLIVLNVLAILTAFSIEFWDLPFPVGFSEVVAVCALFSTIGVSMLALLPNLISLEHQFKESTEATKSSHYAELDTIFMNILKIAIEKPYLRNPSTIKKRSKRMSEYRVYAYLVFNFLETLRDRSKDDEELRRTWGPIIISETHLHWQWFVDETSCPEKRKNPKFCHQFCDFLHRHKKNDFLDLIDLEANRDRYQNASRGDLIDEVDREESKHFADRRSPIYDPWKYRAEKYLSREPYRLPNDGEVYEREKRLTGEGASEETNPWFCKYRGLI